MENEFFYDANNFRLDWYKFNGVVVFDITESSG